MNNLKGFYKENKRLIMITAAVILGIFLIFTMVAVIVNRDRGDDSDRKNSIIKSSATNNAQKDTTEKNQSEDSTDEDETAANQEETTSTEAEEPETVDPDTMPYKIRVNRAANCITIYKKDADGKYTVPVKAITCSTGKQVGDTPLGTFTTLVHYKWLLMVDGTYGQYAYRFYGPILFHSVPYFSQNKADLEWEQYNKLGGPASLGCVRVCVADAIWLIENCAVGTGVEVYDDAGNPGPLGKPETIKIPADSPHRGWDPTDPDKNNPWHNFSPEIKVKKTSVTIARGATEKELLEAIGAVGKDTCGNTVTGKIKVTGVRLSENGTYNSVKLNLTDAIGKTAKEVTVSVTVKTEANTIKPTEKPTQKPTEKPTPKPTEKPTEKPTTEESQSTTAQEETTTKEEPTEEPTTAENVSDADDGEEGGVN